jgi:hypothetical protein
MIIFLPLGNNRSMSVELRHDFGASPFFEKKSFHIETIIDIPYAQIIYTPANDRRKDEERYGDKKTSKIQRHVD